MDLIHIFDASSRDQNIISATDTTMQVEYISEAESDSDGNEGFKRKKFKKSQNREMVIHLFGTKSDGASVRIEVTGFRPFFYVEIPPSYDNPTKISLAKTRIYDEICSKFPAPIQCELVYKQKLIGYTGGCKYPFVKLSVASLGMFYELRKLFLTDQQKPKFRFGGSILQVYESNIDPMLRFFHIQKIQPCGWVSVKGICKDGQIDANWADVLPAVSACVTAPFKHAFWDIECYSHDKEFPVARQGYRRVAKQLWNSSVTLDEVGPLLIEAFADQAGCPIQIPPLKQPKRCPPPNVVRHQVSRPQFVESLAAAWAKKTGGVKEREEGLNDLTKLLDTSFNTVAPIAGDPIIQIGTVSVAGSTVAKHIFVVGGCTPVPDAEVHSYRTEKEMLIAWFDWVAGENFDVFAGYNIFGFDERYIWTRLEELGLEADEGVQSLSRLKDLGGEVKLVEKMLSSSALGDNFLYMWTTPGRLRIDLYSHIKRKVQLGSYKLDAVCAAYLSGKLSGIKAAGAEGEGRWLLKSKQKGDARPGRYVQVLNDLGEDLTDKMVIVEVVQEGIVVASEEDLSLVAGEAAKWAVVKDDVSPQELFRLHRGSDADRGRIAAYCIQDCDLVYELYKKLEVFNEAMSMANVCSVPVGYIFTRGQGIKIESLIFKDCMEAGQLIVVQPGGDGTAGEDSYEGAIVLDPIPGFYADAPVGVCDFASLYPSTIISENISHDMLVWTKDYDMDDKLVCVRYGSVDAERLAPEGTRWTDIAFDILRPEPGDMHKHPKKTKQGTRVCRFAQPAGGQKGSLPTIVAKLLKARKAKRAEIPKTDDPFKKALLDAEQNAYKITANSLYGQLGSRTFKIRLQDLAASVTAYARTQIMFSKAAIEEFYGPDAGDPRCSAKVVYGDTDSLFMSFSPRDPLTGKLYEGREAIVHTMALTEEVGHFVTGALKAPHDFEYEKVFSPFIIFSKKRYVGNKYEDSPDEFKENSMGIVLKRRDNAPLLKMIYGGALNMLLNRRDVEGAVKFVQEAADDLVAGKSKLSQLTITKSLAADYASQPAHKVLADRIKARDPGNAPSSGDRIGFIYVRPAAGQKASKLQGDRIETPQWIVEKGLKPDAEYYIEHQLMNPLSQLFGILLEKMPGFVAPRSWPADPDKCIGQRELMAGEILFRRALQACNQGATANFVSAMFGPMAAAAAGAAAQTKRPVKRSGVRAPAMNPSLVAVAPKRQASLDQFIKDTCFSQDEIMARHMRAEKRSKKAAAAAAAAAEPVKG